MTRLVYVLPIVLGLTACAPQKEYVPVELQRTVPPLPQECRTVPAVDLPPVPEIKAEAVTAEAVNAHWARHWLVARKAYRRAVGDAAICQRYARSLQPKS